MTNTQYNSATMLLNVNNNTGDISEIVSGIVKYLVINAKGCYDNILL